MHLLASRRAKCGYFVRREAKITSKEQKSFYFAWRSAKSHPRKVKISILPETYVRKSSFWGPFWPPKKHQNFRPLRTCDFSTYCRCENGLAPPRSPPGRFGGVSRNGFLRWPGDGKKQKCCIFIVESWGSSGCFEAPQTGPGMQKAQYL